MNIHKILCILTIFIVIGLFAPAFFIENQVIKGDLFTVILKYVFYAMFVGYVKVMIVSTFDKKDRLSVTL